MAGVVLETVSNKKLIAFGVLILILQIIAYILGGTLSPRPYNVQQIIGTVCMDDTTEHDAHRWFWSRNEGQCSVVDSLDYDSTVTADKVVFVFQFPTPKENIELDMSRWHQSMVGVIIPTITYHQDHQMGKSPVMTMQARLGVRDKGQASGAWTELAAAYIDRDLDCTPPKKRTNGLEYSCDMVPLFEIGSVHHDFYLLSVRLPAFDETNYNIGHLKDITLIVIHPNGGFMKLWFSLKIVCFLALLPALIWYWFRVLKQSREPNLLERTVFTLGVAISFLNLPVEVLSLWLYMPFMLFYADVRQGGFYAVLLCFWVIFAGEHLMDTIEKGTLLTYWKQLVGVLFGCICMFVFEMCERGVQLSNPFYSIWGNRTGGMVAYAFIILAGIAACVYFLFLLGLMVTVWRRLSAKRASLAAMKKARRKYYVGIIYRFRFMICTTLFCAALTVIFFILGHTNDVSVMFDDAPVLEYGSAFLTGVYAMWNLYVFSLLILYAPSTKVITTNVHQDASDDEGEQIEFSNIPSETTSLAAEIARKTTID